MSSIEDIFNIATIHVLTMYKCFDIHLNKTYKFGHSELVHFFIGSNNIQLTLKVIEKLGIKDKDSFLDKIKTQKSDIIIEQGVRSFFNVYNRDARTVFPSVVAKPSIEAKGGC